MVSKREHALALAAKGFKVFPIAAGKKFPPLVHAWPERATSDPAVIEVMWPEKSQANIGLHCENMIVLDIDPKKGGDKSLQLLELTYGLPPTRTVSTPSGGQHLYYRSAVAVPNGVDALGAGVDTRSERGYALAPGSETEAGRYAVEQDLPVADAPDWLVQKLGTVAPKSDVFKNEPILDASQECVDRANMWLRTAERSVKGQGGDQAAYRVACFLRDQGVSYQQACELMRSEAWDYGCGWRDGWLESKPIRSAYKYATGEPGSKAAAPADFPAAENIPDLGPRKPKMGLMPLSEFANREQADAGYVVKGMLQKCSYAEIYGAPGEGKTFVALDLAYNVAAEKPWMDRKVHGGPVLYLAYEGIGGLVRRAQALRQRYGHADVPLFICGAALSLREQAGRQELGQLIAGMPAKPVLIVIDTFARALMGGDENSAQDVGAFNSAIAALIESTGACVAIIHHSGKDASKGARGSSALLGALDTEIQVNDGQIISKKQRDVEIAAPIGFKLAPVLVGVDADGDDCTSCVVEPSAVTIQNQRLTGNAKRGFDVLCDLSPNNTPVDQFEWRDACGEFLGNKNVAQRFHDMKKNLLLKKAIVVDGGSVTRRMG